MSCEAIYMLNNWLLSKGATVEKTLAEDLGFKIIYE
jgi:hypothetical protein